MLFDPELGDLAGFRGERLDFLLDHVVVADLLAHVLCHVEYPKAESVALWPPDHDFAIGERAEVAVDRAL